MTMTRGRWPALGFTKIIGFLWIITWTLWIPSTEIQYITGVFSYSDNPWVQDIEFLERNLPRCHKNLFFNVDKNEFFQRAEALKQRAPEMNKEQLELHLSQLLAWIGDSHTCLEDFSFFHTEKVFPINTDWFEDGIYVIGAGHAYREILGQRILAVNGISIDEVIKRIDTLIPHENDWLTRVIHPRYLQSAVMLNFLEVVDGEEAVFTFETMEGSEKKVLIRAAAQDSIYFEMLRDEAESTPLYRKKNDLFWYEYLPEDRLLYFQYNRCWDRNMEEKYGLGEGDPKNLPDFYVFMNDLLKELKTRRVDKFVIDMRANTGGSSRLGMDFIEELWKLKEIRNQGKIFVMVGKKTFSSAIINTLTLKQETDALFFGEPTGGSPNHYGEIKRMTLPNSGVTVKYSTRYFYYSDSYDHTFIPDHVVTATFEDYLKGVDPVLEAIKAYEGE